MDKNIISIDQTIKQNFKNELDKIPFYENRLSELKKTMENKISNKHRLELKKEIDDLTLLIEDIKSKKTFNLYLISTFNLIEEYKKILNTPKKMVFMGSQINTKNDDDKITKEYIKIASKFYSYKIDIEKPTEIEKDNLRCDNCDNTKKFIMLEDSCFVCEKCFSHQELFTNTISHKDSDRINISVKYAYDRKIHFKDCINQYQGKQNCFIEQKVYDDIENMLEKHGMLSSNKLDCKEVRFKKVEKEHILMFLKELKYSKQYENLVLIHYNMTGKKPDDISHLEDKLLEDFDLLLEAYDKLFKNKVNRTNFISTQYVLYQLLRRHKHPCKKEDFIVLKTVDRKTFHDNIFKELAEYLGWNWTG